MKSYNKNLKKLLKSENKIISFDIFDTLITRCFVSPRSIFLLTQFYINNCEEYKSLPFLLKNNFAIIRENIESYTQKKLLILDKKLECTIDEIYNTLKINYNLSEKETLKLKELEIENEKKNLIPIKENIDILKELKKRNTIILTSDIYYSASLLKQILTNIDRIFSDIEIYSSADLNLRKSNGNIYKYLKSIYKNKDIIHLGDNKFSDYTQARWNNIKSYWLEPNLLKKYEKELLQNYSDDLISNLSVGISKFIRLNSQNKVFNFGASFAAPIIYGYVDWVIEDALKNNIEHLYFVARDGYIPKKIADIIIKQKNYPIKTHYFYSSRKATRICDRNNYELFINWIFSEFQDKITIDYIANRLNININDFAKYVNIKPVNKKLNSIQKKIIKEELLKNDELKDIIISKNKIKKNNFIKYINQEINFSTKFAFVDIHGTGRTQDNLVQMISNKLSQPIYSYFFNMCPDMIQNDLSIKKAYFHNIKYINLILEILCRTLHGQTIGYIIKEGKVEPDLEFNVNPYIKEWGYDSYLKGIEKYTELYAKYADINNIKSSNIQLYINYLKYYKNNLDKETANIIGKIPFGIFGDEKKVKECAPAYNLFNIFNNKSMNKYISLTRTFFIPCFIAKLIIHIFTKTNYGYISKEQDIAYIKLFNLKINIKKFLK